MTTNNLPLLILEIIVLMFIIQHGIAEWVQFKQASTNRWDYWSSIYNWMDVLMVILGALTFLFQILSFFNSYLVDWWNRDHYLNIENQLWLTSAQTACYSLMVCTACFKLQDYLTVFRGLYRLMIMIEMMSKQLISFVVILALFVGTFTVCEYIAYGYKDENSYSIGRGFLARVFGLFSGDPVTFGHTDTNQFLGTFYVITFLIMMNLVLMNLVVAMLTSAYDDARKLSSDVLAQRQFEKMNAMGLTKRRTITIQSENGQTLKTLFTTAAEDQFSTMDIFDLWFVTTFLIVWDKFETWLDRRRGKINLVQHRLSKDRLRAQETVFVVPADLSKMLGNNASLPSFQPSIINKLSKASDGKHRLSIHEFEKLTGFSLAQSIKPNRPKTKKD